MSTISGTVSNGVTLGAGAYTSPLTITSSGYVYKYAGAAIFGPNTQVWTVVNYGRVVAKGTSGDGIDLRSPGAASSTGPIPIPRP